MARKLRRGKRRVYRLPEYVIVDMLHLGHDLFKEHPDPETDPVMLETPRAEWQRPHIREAVLEEHARFDGHFGEFCWAQKYFDGAVEDPAKVAAREKAERAKSVDYVLSCCALWQVDEMLTDDEKVEHAERIERLRQLKGNTPRPGTTTPAPTTTETGTDG